MQRLIFIGALLVLVFASADAASRKANIQMVYQPIGDKGDYRLSIYGGRELVCEEQPLKLTDPTDRDPIVINCDHHQPVIEPQLAEGEWKIEVQLQPCAGNQIEPIWNPKNPGILTVECNHMPVAVK